MSTEVLGEMPVVDHPVDGKQPELVYLSITTVIKRPSKVNQHEVELGDIELGERIGYLTKDGEERQGEVTAIQDHPHPEVDDLMFRVMDDAGFPQAIRGESVVWREIL